jgi:hypothetical protein
MRELSASEYIAKGAILRYGAISDRDKVMTIDKKKKREGIIQIGNPKLPGEKRAPPLPGLQSRPGRGMGCAKGRKENGDSDYSR